MTHTLALIVFWVSVGLVVYTYAGFPLLLMVRGILQHRPVRKEPITPAITLLVTAHNEAESISAKIENINALDYPKAQLEVIIASDGSDDGTNDIVGHYERPGLRLLALPRTGKIRALNAAAEQAAGDVLVFSDANSMYAPDALRALVAPFADPRVGAVGGNQCYLRDGRGHTVSQAERLYWSYDRALKLMQSRAGHMTAATGAIHAIRRDLFKPVPLGVSDDFMTSTRAIAAGYRLVFEPSAIAYETVAPSEKAEFKRKLRIIVRGLRGLWLGRELFNPLRHGFYSLQLFSHKFLRWSVCWVLLLAAASSLLLYNRGSIYQWAVLLQIALAASAGLSWALRNSPIAKSTIFKLFGIPLYFFMANYAALQAWLQVLAGKRVDSWDSGRATTVLPQFQLQASTSEALTDG